MSIATLQILAVEQDAGNPAKVCAKVTRWDGELIEQAPERDQDMEELSGP